MKLNAIPRYAVEFENLFPWTPPGEGCHLCVPPEGELVLA